MLVLIGGNTQIRAAIWIYAGSKNKSKVFNIDIKKFLISKLLCKSMDWFLYYRYLRHERVKDEKIPIGTHWESFRKYILKFW